MADKQQQNSGDRKGHKQQHNWIIKKKAYARRILKDEINSLKAKVREAYTVEFRRNDEGYEPTEEELVTVEEQSLNNKLIEKLEKLYDTQRTTSTNREPHVEFITKEISTLMHFFYLVRLAQQGFFYLISGAYPALEPQAVTYLCDKIIGTNMYAGRATDKNERHFHKRTLADLVAKLVNEVDEPVAEEFRTTYRQIMVIVNSLMHQSMKEQKKNNREKKSEDEKSETTKNAPAAIPPIWVVMPYSSMMDGSSFAMPGAIPSLPYPSTLLPTGFMPAGAVPFMPRPNPAEDYRNHVAKQEEEEQKEEEVKDEVNEEVKDEVKDETEENVEEEKNQEEIEEDQAYDNYDEDRFADADLFDDYKEEEDEEVEESPKPTEEEIPVTTQEETKIVNNTDDSNKYQDVTVTAETKSVASSEDTEISTKANSSWLNFAASPPKSESYASTASSSPRKRNFQQYQKSKKY